MKAGPMDSNTKLLLGICLLIPLLVIVNLALFSAYRSRNRQNRQGMIIQARNRLTDPWKEEDDHLAQLSKAVNDLDHSPASTSDKREDGMKPPGSG